ncbi:MAG: C10 family peptidase [Bacteroidales bacterium]|nr:C10 family peptidase [Bacteroidales bacterium]MBR4324982.1 C10 family peptidase [Bacteroidales bacterium]
MKKFLSLSFLVLFLVATLVSCDDDLSPNNEVVATESPQESVKDVPSVTLTQDEMILLAELSNGSPKLSQEQAMEIACNFLNKETAPSLSKRGVTMPRCEVLTRAKQRISKSGIATEDADTMLYVFNYDNGYAVVSADVRVPEQILAFSEEGNLHLDSDNPYIDMFMDMASDYIDDHIAQSELMRDSLEKVLSDKIATTFGIAVDTTPTLSKSVRVVDRFLLTNGCWDYTTYKSTEVTGPFIDTYWHQEYPYNGDATRKGGKQCPAGCTSIAISQLMAYWKWPNHYDNGKTIDWSSITKDYYAYNYSDKRNIAEFVHKVGVAINTKYDASGSGAWLEDGVEFLKKHGYKTSGVTNYSAEEIRKSISKERPVAIVGYNIENGEMEGHTWLIDGYAKLNYDYNSRRTYVVITEDDITGRRNGELEVHSSEGTSYCYYHHFNLGWGTNTNTNARGYFLENTFNVKSERRLESGKGALSVTNSYDANDFKYLLIIATNIYH